MSAAPNGSEYVTRAEFLDLKSEVDELGPLIRNSMRDLQSYTAKQQVFLANQEIRDKELRRQVRGLQREDADLRDSVRDLSGEAVKAEMIRLGEEVKRRDSIIRRQRGWTAWAVRGAVTGGAIAAWEIVKYLFWKGP